MIRFTALLTLALLFAAGCNQGTEGQFMGDCSDGVDNDDDGELDCADKGCKNAAGCDDNDEDGWYEREDCDDNDASINPGVEETWYDGIDQDCDGRSDYDQDRDNHQSDEYGGTDCDDLDPDSNPNADEVWYDGVDQDCAEDSDYDQDYDGYESAHFGGTDCDDTRADVFPGAEETWYDGTDADCDGWSDYDQDRDGHDIPDGGGGDCDDLDPEINPDEVEIWYDGVDKDCDEWSDYDQDYDGHDSDAYGGDDCDDLRDDVYTGHEETWYDGTDADCDGHSDYDQDFDGYDSDAYDPDGDGNPGLDCDDLDDGINPDQTETWYDGVDQDCDYWWSDYDRDFDGHESEDYDPDGDGIYGDDCEDEDPDISPSATETWYDGTDQDCDGLSDYDQDYDGYDSEDEHSSGTDCDDTDDSINPGETETWYDGIDSDCDEWSDYDQDYDTYDSEDYSGTDCDDEDDTINTDADEIWYDGVDQDCDDWSDYDQDFDGFDHEDYDADGDGTYGTDCNDEDDTVSPAETEICDDYVDNDCDYTSNGCSIEDITDLSVADAKITGESSGDFAAWSVAGAGDLDGDGYDDLLIGAPNDDDSARNSGAAYVLYGPVTGTVALSAADAKLAGVEASQQAGTTVAPAGDVDGDGYPDVVVGVIGDEDGGFAAGAVYLFSGPLSGSHDGSDATAKIIGDEDAYVSSVMATGGFDTDSYADLLIGAYTEGTTGTGGGAVYVITGPITGDVVLSEDADLSLFAESAGDYAGWAAAFEDIDADGVDDVIVGAHLDDDVGTDSGAVYVHLAGSVSGSVSLSLAESKFTGEAAGDHAGISVTVAEDIDGDGYSDMVIGAEYEGTGGTEAGAAYVVLGDAVWTTSASLSTADAKLVGDSAGDWAGWVVAAGDFDDDSYSDLLVAVPEDNYGGTQAGAVHLVYGSVSGSYDLGDSEAKLVGEDTYDYAGWDIDLAGDVDGDGYDDLIVGAYGDDAGGSSAGAAYLFLGGSE